MSQSTQCLGSVVPWQCLIIVTQSYIAKITLNRKTLLMRPKERQLSKYTIKDPLTEKICSVFGGLPNITAQSATTAGFTDHSHYMYNRKSLWACFWAHFPPTGVLFWFVWSARLFNIVANKSSHQLILFNWPLQYSASCIIKVKVWANISKPNFRSRQCMFNTLRWNLN